MTSERNLDGRHYLGPPAIQVPGLLPGEPDGPVFVTFSDPPCMPWPRLTTADTVRAMLEERDRLVRAFPEAPLPDYRPRTIGAEPVSLLQILGVAVMCAGALVVIAGILRALGA